MVSFSDDAFGAPSRSGVPTDPSRGLRSSRSPAPSSALTLADGADDLPSIDVPSIDLTSLREALLREGEEGGLEAALERAGLADAVVPLAEGDLSLVESLADGTRAPADRSGEDPSLRPVRSGPLRDLLDAEFQRCHRFDTISTFLGDLRSLLRKAVQRESDEDREVEEFQRSSGSNGSGPYRERPDAGRSVG